MTSLLREVEDLRREVSVLSEKLDLVLGLLGSDKDSIGSFELFEGNPRVLEKLANQQVLCSRALLLAHLLLAFKLWKSVRRSAEKLELI